MCVEQSTIKFFKEHNHKEVEMTPFFMCQEHGSNIKFYSLHSLIWTFILWECSKIKEEFDVIIISVLFCKNNVWECLAMQCKNLRRWSLQRKSFKPWPPESEGSWFSWFQWVIKKVWGPRHTLLNMILVIFYMVILVICKLRNYAHCQWAMSIPTDRI